MEEVQEQSHVCKICNKSCVSGKSLGGHMRVHLAQISASKKSAEEKFEIKMEFEDGDDQYRSSQIKGKPKKQPKTGSSNSDSANSDLNDNNYELRDNPKKSCRFMNSATGILENGLSCKECGQEFPTTRALSGHMRCHSIKNKEIHHCKTCGKGFDSMRAMFGHMKSHSKKSRIPVNSTDSLSDLDNFCPVRRKRSIIRYKIPPNPSFSSLNESNSAVSEISEVEIAAASLLMLSKGVREWIRLESVTETAADYDSDYFGAGKIEKIATENNNVSQFGDLDFKFAAENDLKFSTEVSGDGLGSIDKFKKHEELNKSSIRLSLAYDSKISHSAKLTEVEEEDVLGETDMDETVSEFLKSNSFKTQSVSVNNSYENDVIHVDILSPFEEKRKYKCGTAEKLVVGLRIEENSSLVNLESSKRKKHECPVCFEVFASGQALGGHKRAHFNRFTESKMEQVTEVKQEVGIKDLFVDLNFPVNVGGAKAEVGSDHWWVESSQIGSIALSLN